MKLLPRSLFGRLALLLVAVVALTVLTSFVLFRQERSNLLNRQLSETKLAQLQAIRTALEGVDGPAAASRWPSSTASTACASSRRASARPAVPRAAAR